jgi:hypothetical protein
MTKILWLLASVVLAFFAFGAKGAGIASAQSDQAFVTGYAAPGGYATAFWDGYTTYVYCPYGCSYGEWVDVGQPAYGGECVNGSYPTIYGCTSYAPYYPFYGGYYHEGDRCDYNRPWAVWHGRDQYGNRCF